MGRGNSKPETVNDPAKPISQKDTHEASNTNQNSAKEKNDYQKIDQHARKVGLIYIWYNLFLLYKSVLSNRCIL
jgi:hypothetical protein